MTADLGLLREREQLLSARIATTGDPHLRENLLADLRAVTAQIAHLARD